jgi:hypothetical protein
MAVGMTVRVGTLVPAGRPAMYATARPVSATSIVGSLRVEPSAWSVPSAAPEPIDVAALPMSICPQAMPNGRPSSWSCLVSPAIPCFATV